MNVAVYGLATAALFFYLGYATGVKSAKFDVKTSRDGQQIPVHCICKPVGVPDDEAPKLEFDVGT